MNENFFNWEESRFRLKYNPVQKYPHFFGGVVQKSNNLCPLLLAWFNLNPSMDK